MITCETINDDVKPRNLIKLMTEKVMVLLTEEIEKPETQQMIKHKLISPLINLIYNELYPYLVTLSCVILVILVLSILTFVGFIVYYLKTL